MADGLEDDEGAGGAGAVDLAAFVPESFKGEDGNWDTAGFRQQFDDLAADKAARDERLASLPESPDDYAFSIGEDHVFPEGFDPKAFGGKDGQGNEVEFDPAKMIQGDDPDVKSVKELMHALDKGEVTGADAAKTLAGVMVNREIRQMMEAAGQREEQIRALGPDARSRIDTVTRSLKSRLPGEQASALSGEIVSADGLRAVEGLLRLMPKPTQSDTNTGVDNSQMNPMERVMSGLQQRSKKTA